MFKLQSVRVKKIKKFHTLPRFLIFYYHFCCPEFADSESVIKYHLFFEVTEKNSNYIYLFERKIGFSDYFFNNIAKKKIFLISFDFYFNNEISLV